MLLQSGKKPTDWEAGRQHNIYYKKWTSESIKGHVKQHHCGRLWCVFISYTQMGCISFLKRSDYRMYVSSSFAGNKEPGFARYTIPVPVPEPTIPVVTDAPADSSPVSCSIFPTTGTVLDAFDITCKASSFCSAGCSYCFRTDTGENVSLRGKNRSLLHWSEENAD